MFDFIRKKDIWEACDAGVLESLQSGKISYQLKHAQDIATYWRMRDLKGQRIAEVGGGNSRVLEALATNNQCFNVEKFEGRDLGPDSEVVLNGVDNINAYVGDFDEALAAESFDYLFSISVVEHIENAALADFFEDSLRILKSGGVFLHAVDLYLSDTPTEYNEARFATYREWLNHKNVEALAEVNEGPLVFSTTMATNPDNILYGWNTLVPSLKEVRAEAQSVSLLVGGRKL